MVKINVLFLLLLLEVLLILLVSAAYLFLKNRKYKILILNTLREPQPPIKEREKEEETGGDIIIPESGLEFEPEPIPTPPPEPKPVVELKPQPEVVLEPPPIPAPPQEKIELPKEDSAKEKSRMDQLYWIIEFEKSVILDLMRHKEEFEETQKELAVVQKHRHEIEDRVKTAVDGIEKNEEIKKIVETLKNNGRELESFAGMFKDEQDELSKIFMAWENELKNLIDAAGYGEGIDGSVGEDRYLQAVKDRETIKAKAKELEKELKEKTELLNQKITEFKDLEKEYMVLYRQQQQQQQQEQQQEQQQQQQQQQEKPEAKPENEKASPK